MWRAGFSNDMPNMFSITIWCERPMPRMKRPPDAACVVSACWASIIGWRGIRGHDGRAELDARHLAPDDRERRDRVHAEDLWKPVRRESVGLGLAGVGDDVVDRAVRGVAAEDADAHVVSSVRSAGG